VDATLRSWREWEGGGGVLGCSIVVVRDVGEEGGMSVVRVKPRGSEGAAFSEESTGDIL